MANDVPPKTNFQRLAVSSTIFFLVATAASAGIVLVLKWQEAGSHSYQADRINWQNQQQRDYRHNAFWLVIAGRNKPSDNGDTLLALDLRCLLVEPAADIETQLQSTMRLADKGSAHAYGELSQTIYAELNWPWGMNTPPPSFLRNVELTKAGKVDDILVQLAPEPNRDDPKYAFDMMAEVKKFFSRDRIIGLYLAVTLMTALCCELFRSRGWWRWDAEDAVFKIWLVALLAPIVTLWLACVILWVWPSAYRSSHARSAMPGQPAGLRATGLPTTPTKNTSTLSTG